MATAKPPSIDLDRGVIIRTHGGSGMQVYMYWDTPGVFLNAYENPVGVAIAAEAGYDVVRLGRDRQKRERLASAMAEVEAQYGDDGVAGTLIEDRDGYRLVARGMGMFQIEDAEGGVLTPRPLSEDEARLVFDKLTAPEVPEPEPEAEPFVPLNVR